MDVVDDDTKGFGKAESALPPSELCLMLLVVPPKPVAVPNVGVVVAPTDLLMKFDPNGLLLIVLALAPNGIETGAVAIANGLAEEPKEEEGLASDPKPALEFAGELKGRMVLLPYPNVVACCCC